MKEGEGDNDIRWWIRWMNFLSLHNIVSSVMVWRQYLIIIQSYGTPNKYLGSVIFTGSNPGHGFT